MLTPPILRLAALCLFVSLVACSSEPRKPTTLTGTINASEQVNPSASKRPSPLLMRVYLLKSAAAFGNADFMSLYQRDQAELAADLLGREEYMVSPGESLRFTTRMAPETRFVGVFAAFQALESSVWRKVVPVQPGTAPQLLIRAGQLSVDASVTR